ncbi:MAG: hypothetical protein QXD57_02935 [Ignisphaera sp.]
MKYLKLIEEDRFIETILKHLNTSARNRELDCMKRFCQKLAKVSDKQKLIHNYMCIEIDIVFDNVEDIVHINFINIKYATPS